MNEATEEKMVNEKNEMVKGDIKERRFSKKSF